MNRNVIQTASFTIVFIVIVALIIIIIKILRQFARILMVIIVLPHLFVVSHHLAMFRVFCNIFQFFQTAKFMVNFSVTTAKFS